MDWNRQEINLANQFDNYHNRVRFLYKYDIRKVISQERSPNTRLYGA